MWSENARLWLRKEGISLRDRFGKSTMETGRNHKEEFKGKWRFAKTSRTTKQFWEDVPLTWDEEGHRAVLEVEAVNRV